MILRIFILACVVVSPSLGKLVLGKFTAKFEDMCFQNEETDPFRVNGQEVPLSNTLENFISLAEKFEVANPSFDLKDEIVYFITEYVFENIKFVNGKLDQWKIGRADLKAFDSLWDPDVKTSFKPTPTDPFTEAEKCSLYYMISHSLLKKEDHIPKSYSPGNFSYNPNRAYSPELNPDDYYPQELGVVAIRGTDSAISVSKVLTGLYAGLLPDRIKALTEFEGFQDKDIPEDVLPADIKVDAVYAVTLAENLMQAQWIGNDRTGLAPNGDWVSIPLSSDKVISGFCPMVYKQQVQNGNMPLHSYSSIRGAADGLLLGMAIDAVNTKKTDSKLSQILRMYYSPDGISLESPLEGTNEKRISFCNRQDLITSVENKLQEQMKLYGYLIAESFKDVENVLNKAKSLYTKEKAQIFDSSTTDIRDYCTRSYNLEKPEDLPRETFLDIIAVMDSSNSLNSFQEQQLILGYVAKQLDLRYTGSRMTILLDRKDQNPKPNVGSAPSNIDLESVVYDTYSSSCAACFVGQVEYESSSIERVQVIEAIDQFLEQRKLNETKDSGANGKVVIYFNYDNDNGKSRNNKVQGNLEKTLRKLHLGHQDVLFYAVGLDSEVIKKYAKNDPSLVFLSTDGSPEDVAKRIFLRITLAPALLQYADCEEAKSENAAIYENFVSPQKIQHYEMPAEYFYKSTSISVNFESQNGYIRVCHNRATMRPENEARFCKNTTGNTGIEFKMSNPCKSFTKETCSPFYFSIMGMDTNSDLKPDTRTRDYCKDIKDHWCANLDQVKFKVSHTGIRCSGCLRLGAQQTIILFTILLTYIVYKRF